jgi:hypothetical protein
MVHKTSRDVLEQPLVSIIMLFHNRKSYLIKAILSVLTQNYCNFELILYGTKTSYIYNGGVGILNVWTTNIQKTNLFEKGITTLLIEVFYYFAIKKYVVYNDVDLSLIHI